MATYGGHALPGVIFMFLSVWLTTRTNLTSLSTRYNHRQYLLMEGILILSLVSCGCFVELFWPWNGNHPPFGHIHDPTKPDEFYKPMNWQHFTMYMFFGLYGFTRILEHKAPFLTGIDRLSGGFAFFIEGFLFHNHVHGRAELDKLIHILIVVVCYGSASLFILSFFIKCRRRLYIIDMLTSILVFAQGTWFIHVAEIIYGKHSWPGVLGPHDHMHLDMPDDHELLDEKPDNHSVGGGENMDIDHMNMMFAVTFFSWHVVFATCLNILIAYIIYKTLQRKNCVDTSFVSNDEESKDVIPQSNKIKYESLRLDDAESPLLTSVDDEENDIFLK